MRSPRIAAGVTIGGLAAGITLVFAVPAQAAPAPSLGVSVTAQPSQVAVGQAVTVSITARNTSTQPTDVQLSTTTPTNVSYVSSNGCGQSGNAVQCNLSSVPAGGNKTVTIQLKATQPGTGSEVVKAYAGNPQQLAATASAAITVQSSASTQPAPSSTPPAPSSTQPASPSTSGNNSGSAGSGGGSGQISRVPSGGVDTGGGATAGVQHIGEFTLGGLAILAAAGVGLIAARSRRSEQL